MCILSQKIGDMISTKMKTARVQGSASVDAAMEIMDMYETDVIAVECEKEFAGVFSRADFSRNVTRHNLNPMETTLYEVMSINMPSIGPEDSVKDAYETMLAYQREFMPILDGTMLIAIVSIRDLGQAVMQSYDDAKMENDMIMHYIQCGESYGTASYNFNLEQAIKNK